MGDRGMGWPADPRLLDAFDAAAFVVDGGGRVVYANESAERRFGRPPAPLTGELLLTSLFRETEREQVAPLLSRVLDGQTWRGRLEVLEVDGAAHEVAVRCSPLWAQEAVAGLVCVVDDGAGTQQVADRALGDRLTRLARATAELVMADSVEGIAKVIVSHGADAAGATIASLVLREDEDTVRLVDLRGGREGDEKTWATYSLDTKTPGTDAIRSGDRVVVIGRAAIAERYPDLKNADQGERSILSIPLKIAPRVVGAIGFSFPGPRILDAAELELFDILADMCAQAIERITAQEVAAAQTAKLVFLAGASTELASSLDYELTLANVARLAVPTFADWCAIDVVEDGRLHRVAVEHVDPAKVQLARELAERYPADPDAPNGAWHVMRTGRSELIREITDELLAASAVDEEQLRIARDLHLRSVVTVPLVARGRVLGVITWVLAESERHYNEDDLTLAEDLAQRAAVAIDNAELHSQTLAAAVQLQHAVLPAELTVPPGWDLDAAYSPSGRTEVGGDFYDAIPLSDGRLAMFVGDVMGRGVAAAAAMAHMRAAIRAYAAIDPTPSIVLDKLDQMFAQFPTEQLVTVVFVLADPARDEIQVANAGHPPPVILRADLSCDELPMAEGSPLGVFPQERSQTVVPFRSGDLLLMFTDGLIERREEDINQGQQRVVDALPGLVGPDLSSRLADLVDRLRDPSRDDDVAALAARRTP
jgi:PAS domain S-box-containing protein